MKPSFNHQSSTVFKPREPGTNHRKISITGLRILVVCLLTLAIVFRFSGLDRKIYWHDETFTSMRVSGYTEAEMVQEVSASELTTVEALQTYQQIKPESTVVDTVKSLVVEDPQHPPLYYTLASLWARGLDTSIATIRSLSALISLLVFLCAYWLCLELFGSARVAWVAMAVFAVAPIHLVYAQEARQYALFTVTVLASSAALLRAMRQQTLTSWVIYAIAIATSFYTFLLSALVAIGHGIYVLALEKLQFTKITRSYLLASLAAVLSFTPWIVVLAVQRDQADRVTGWTRNAITFTGLIREWVVNFSRIFIDWNYQSEVSTTSKIAFYTFVLFLIAVVGYAFYFLWRNTSSRIWLFVFTLTGVTALTLAIPDLLTGGHRSTVNRYLIPSYIGIELAVAYLLASQLSQVANQRWKQRVWYAVSLVLMTGGLFSCFVGSQANSWWIQAYNQGNLAIAPIIQQADRPLVVSDAQAADLLSLSYHLDADVPVIARPQCYTCTENKEWQHIPFLPDVPDGFTDVVLFSPRSSPEWTEQLNAQNQRDVEVIVADQTFGTWAWRVNN
ncbi:MAG: hypothetical protein Kow00121_33570 [Elainellaceae cyanobacterium]